MKKVIFATDKGNTFNEDFVYGTKEWGFLLDGATGLFPEKITLGNTDAQFFVQEISRLLIKKQTIHQSLFTNLKEAVKEIRDYFPESKKNVWPSCTFIGYEIKNNHLNVYSIGDSPLVIFTKDSFTIFSDEQLEKNEQHALKEMSYSLKKGATLTEARAAIEPLLLKNRQSKNTPSGYFIIDPSTSWESQMKKSVFPLGEVTGLMLASDGFYRLFHLFKVLEIKHTLKELATYEHIIYSLATLRKLENQENSLLDFPRLKKSDDASVLVALFS